MIGGNLFYFLIRRENGLNDRLKLVKNERKETEIERNKNESQETRNELKVLDLETYPLKNEEQMKNGRRTVKNGGKPSRICLRKHLASVTEALRLGFSSRKQFFSPKTAEMHSQGDQGPLEQPPSAYL